MNVHTILRTSYLTIKVVIGLIQLINVMLKLRKTIKQ